jgi:ABC-type branched-subunit amino acid transport system substrate-binding protein
MFRNYSLIKKTATLMCTAALTAGIFAVVAPNSGASGLPSKIVIGSTMPLTGSGAAFGDTMLLGEQTAAKYINSHGGVGANHAKIQIVSLDDQALAAPAVVDTKQLIKVNHAIGIITTYNDPPLAQYKIGQQLGAPIIAITNDPSILNKPNLYLMGSLFTSELAVAFNYAKAHGVKSAGLLFANNNTAYDIAQYQKIADNVFGSPQTSQTFDAASTDVTTQLQALQAKNPDVISPLASGSLVLTIAQDMAQLKMTQKIVSDSGTLNTPPQVTTMSAWNGAIAGVPVMNPTSWLNSASVAAKQGPASIYTEFAANSVYLIKAAVESLEKAGKAVTGKNVNSQIAAFSAKSTPFAAAGTTINMLPSHNVSCAFAVHQVTPTGSVKVLATIPTATVIKWVNAATK